MALMIGIAAIQQLDIVEVARLPLAELRDEFGQTVSLSIWGNLGPTVVRWLDGARPLLTDPKVGAVMPLLWSTIGHVFLAYLPPNRTEAFILSELRREGNSGQQVDRKRLQTIANEVRRVGLAVREAPAGASHGEVFQPTRAISAPIFRADGRIEGVVTLVGSARAIDIEPQAPWRWR
jgi:DNA-binding IclR family transcriptional regulator